MKFLFRVDASLEIGNGHVIRCLTLAETLRRLGMVSRFICREHPGHLIDLIIQRGFDVYRLPGIESKHALTEKLVDRENPYASWLGSTWKIDVKQSSDAINDFEPTWLIVDHYAIDARWEIEIRPLCLKIMVIDDLANRPHVCDLLLDQNPGRHIKNYADLVNNNAIVLIGPHYSLLRPEFAKMRTESLGRRISSPLKQFLISMGGVDKNNDTGRIIEALKSIYLPEDSRITVVMGPNAPWFNRVLNQVNDLPWEAEVKVNVQDMAELMAQSDLLIGAAGTTALEACCLGLPMLLMVIAYNQIQNAEWLVKAECAMVIGTTIQFHEDLQEKMSLLMDQEILRLMQQHCLAITDGKGAVRVAKVLLYGTDQSMSY